MNFKNIKRPKILTAESAIDDRGQIIFANSFDFKNIKRFYVVSNHRSRFIRAWHGHKKESKFIIVLHGTALICAVKIDNWKKPNKNQLVEKFILSEKKPKILFIPGGYANGFKTLEKNTKLLIYSTSSISQSTNDDFRFDSKYWNPWKIIER